MVGHKRLSHVQPLAEVADTQLLASQRHDDPPAQRVAERPGDPVAITLSGAQQDRALCHIDQV